VERSFWSRPRQARARPLSPGSSLYLVRHAAERKRQSVVKIEEDVVMSGARSD
jgi:hypothetical protein